MWKEEIYKGDFPILLTNPLNRYKLKELNHLTMQIKRSIQPRVEAKLFQGKAIIIYGARQVGKTTLVTEILNHYKTDSVYLNCDEPDVRQALTHKTSTELRAYIGDKKLVVFDEAQRVLDIGLTLKLLIDTSPGMQIIATGSSSFDLSNKISEPLTGRIYEFYLYPFSLDEILSVSDRLETMRLIERYLQYGMYPSAILKPSEAGESMNVLTKSYLYKDVLGYQRIKNPDILEKLVQALALQIGNEVSGTELSNLLGIDQKTVMNYIRILEQAFIIFTLRPLARNHRKELSKLRKVYFYDVGVRNAIINNVNPLSLRTDTGALWENFCISERIKCMNNSGNSVNSYFWRTWDGAEVDYVEDAGGKLQAFELKWTVKKQKAPVAWSTNYPDSTYAIIHRENVLDFVTRPV